MEVKGIKPPDIPIAKKHGTDSCGFKEKHATTIPFAQPVSVQRVDYPDLILSGKSHIEKTLPYERSQTAVTTPVKSSFISNGRKSVLGTPPNSGHISKEEIERAKSFLFHANEPEIKPKEGNILKRCYMYVVNIFSKSDNQQITTNHKQYNSDAIRYEKHKSTLDKYFKEKHIPQEYLSDDDYSYAVVMIDKRANGELTQEEFEEERIEFEKSKAQRKTQEIIPKDAKTLTREQQDELNETFAMLGDTDACLVFATAEDVDNPEEKMLILTEFASEDMIDKQGEITEAVLEVLPETLEEGFISICAKATTAMSESSIKEKEKLLENELKILSEEEKARIREKLAIQMEGIKLQNELLVLNHIKETQKSITKHYKDKIEKTEEKYEEIKEEQRTTEKEKEKLEVKLHKRQNKLEQIEKLIKQLKKELATMPKFLNPTARRFHLARINAAIHLKEHVEESIQNINADIRTADIEISSDLSMRQQAVHNMQASCRSWMMFNTANLINQ